jgi:hypothetical protein
MKKALRLSLAAVALLLVLGAVAVRFGPPSVPPEAIAASVTRTPALMAKAWALPVASSFKQPIAYQRNGSVCGPASLSNVFASLGAPVGDEGAVVAGSGKCWSGVCFMGLTLDELAEVARLRTQRKVTVLRDLTPDAFREHLRKANDPKLRYVVNFDRKPIFGAGGGHHSPIGGYLEDEDLVLVLDVNAKFEPWLVERERLFKAIDGIDGMSKQKRGLLVIE